MTNFLANPLNEYETYTYNLKIYMISPVNFQKLDALIGTEDAILIADNSRVSKYNISDCEQIHSIGHSLVREAFDNRFSLTIDEPNGVTLLSTIKTAALQLGIENHIQAGYLLVLEFNGRVSDGTARKFPTIFYYPTTITAFNFNVSEGGTTYQIEMVEKSASGYRYLGNTVKGQVTIVAQTVGEFFDQFETLINETMIDAWEANISNEYPIQYKFEFDETTEDWREWRFQVLDTPFEVAGTEFIGLPDNNPSLQISISNGTQITSVFSNVLQLTSEYKRILVSQESFGQSFARQAPNEFISTDLDALPVFMKVLTNVEYGPFDTLAGEFSKTYVYKLKSYTVTGLVLDSEMYSRGITNTSVQTKRVDNMIANNLLRKRYDYIYTGKNTEILELDMSFNNSYYEIMPNGAGYFGDPRVQTPQFIQDSPEVIGRIAEITNGKSQLSAAVSNLNTLRKNNESSTFIDIAVNDVQTRRANLTDTISRNTIFLNEQYGLSPQDISWRLRWAQDAVSGQDMNTSDNDERSGNLKFGAVKVNLENSADFHTIELGIRGDPYWLGLPSSFDQSTRNVAELADYEAGSINFFLNINFPSTEEDNDGRRKPNPDYQLSGVFQVINVINRYRNGQFTQHLKATRDMGTNVSTAWERLAGNNNVITAQRSQSLENARNIAQEAENAFRRISGTGNII